MFWLGQLSLLIDMWISIEKGDQIPWKFLLVRIDLLHLAAETAEVRGWSSYAACQGFLSQCRNQHARVIAARDAEVSCWPEAAD
jgi:hypothetical protein